jgi:hypothetical protein
MWWLLWIYTCAELSLYVANGSRWMASLLDAAHAVEKDVWYA